MTKTTITWAVLFAVYLLFFGWYTSFGGPLTDEEVDHYFAKITEKRRDAPPEVLAIIREFLETDTGDDFVMFNVIDMYETPPQVEGVEPGETSQELLDKYMQYISDQSTGPVAYVLKYPSSRIFGLDPIVGPYVRHARVVAERWASTPCGVWSRCRQFQ